MLKVTDFENYKDFVNALLKAAPKNGRGEFRKMAMHLNVHSTLMSQIFRGEKNLSEEQALDLCRYFALKDLEKKYFMLLVHYEKAGSKALKEYYLEQMSELQVQASQVVTRISQNMKLNKEWEGIFYSNWYYAAIRLLIGTKGAHSIDSVSQKLNLPKIIIRQAVDALLSMGLIVETKTGLKSGAVTTHLSLQSPLVTRHHMNWRIKSMERHAVLTEQELVFTAPLSLSEKDVPKIKNLLLNLIETVAIEIKPSAPEKVMCLTIDWTKVS